MVDRLRNQKGFTLIELSIVLVIIGIILSAVLKGQDLINNAKAKKVASIINQWQVPMMGYYDRKGYLPGDAGVAGGGTPNGLIISIAVVTASLSAAGMYYPNPVVGDISVNISNGTACGAAVSGGVTKNFMLITLPVTASQTLVEAIDTNVDGTALANSGRLMACGTGGTTAPATSWTGVNVLTYIF